MPIFKLKRDKIGVMDKFTFFKTVFFVLGEATVLLFLLLIVNRFPPTRIYGCYDIQPCFCFPQHLLKEGHEGEVRQWHELLCLPVNNVPCHTDSICYCYGRPPNVGCWLAKGSCRSWPQCYLVNKKFIFLHFSLYSCHIVDCR